MTSCNHFMEITEHSHHKYTRRSHTAVIGLCCPHSLPHVTCLNNVTRDDVGEVQGLGLKCEIWFRWIQINGRLEAAKKNILEVETISLWISALTSAQPQPTINKTVTSRIALTIHTKSSPVDVFYSFNQFAENIS